MGEQKTQHHVLIVDDEPNVTGILAKSLSKLGEKYLVETANRGGEALKKATDTAYDLVIVDYRMPEMNGLDFITRLRHQSPQTQVVLMTAHGTVELRKTVNTMNLDGYLDKPFTLEQIRQIVKKALDKPKTEPDPFRNGERVMSDSVQDKLEVLRTDTGARCVMLISSNGYPIEAVGAVTSLDISSVGVLVAANFAAAVELSKLLGNDSIFKSSYHEGPDYNIYAYDINSEVLLAVIFGTESRPGTVWFYAKQAATALEPELEAETEMSGFGEEEFNAGLAELDRDLDDFFGYGEEHSGDHPELFSLEEAAKAGLVSVDLLTEES